MNVLDKEKKDMEQEEMNSLKGTLVSTLVFVGGGITLFILLLFYFYLTRV